MHILYVAMDFGSVAMSAVVGSPAPQPHHPAVLLPLKTSSPARRLDSRPTERTNQNHNKIGGEGADSQSQADETYGRERREGLGSQCT